MQRTKRFFLNGIILGATTVLLRGASLGFQVYITNKIGAEGIGLFGLIMSVYMLATTVASSGASFATTRLVTEEAALGCGRGMQKVMAVCLVYTLFFGTLATVLLFSLAPQIGRYWLCDMRTVRPLYLLSVSLPFIALSSAINGYFAAVRHIVKSASAQIFEMVIKVLVTVFALGVFAERGIEYACIAVVGGGSIAEICSFIYLFALYKLEKRRQGNCREGERQYTKRLLKVAMPIAISSYLRSVLVTLEHLLVPPGLQKYGASASLSLAQYGVVHGMVMPLLMFPSAVLGAFSGLLIPELTEFQKTGNPAGISRIATRTIRTTLWFSIFTAGIFFAFSYELGQAFYHSGDAGLFIRFLAPLVVVMYADGVVDAMLKGLNRQVHSMRYNIIDSVVSVIMIYTLLPRYGINGYIAVIFVTELLNAYLSLNCLLKTTSFQFSLKKDVLLPCAFALFAGYGVRFLSRILYGSVFCGRWQIMIYILLAGFIYIAFLAAFGCFDKLNVFQRRLPAFF